LDTDSPRLDVFSAANFVDARVCNELIAEAKTSASFPAQVTKSKGRVDVDMRRTSRLIVSDQTAQRIAAYFQELKPQLETYYDLSLSGFEKFQFLLYRKGDFYKRHADKNDKTDSPAYIRARRISVVIFLNHEGQHDEPDSYTGGGLVIWTGQDPQKIPSRIEGEIGKVIAFPSELMHEVEMVKSGERYSIVNWFF
jgi:predicted 2-oxoglutarate/Fe(II)-dependent dioxygenase YbiX